MTGRLPSHQSPTQKVGTILLYPAKGHSPPALMEQMCLETWSKGLYTAAV